jgi:excinuclease ABC subunit C
MLDLTVIPENPGCYLYKDKTAKVIYIGKAKSLKKRVSSYFAKTHADLKTQALVENIADIDFIVTNSEKEALILESNLVKKFQPKYNIQLKDGKRYAYIELTHESFPRVMLCRKKEDNGEYFGPFTSGLDRNILIETINKHFQLRTCKRLPKRECIRYHMGLCPAPCINKISEEDYDKNVSRAKMILKGKTHDLAAELETEMRQAAEATEFERAKTLRDQLFALQRLDERQNMERSKKSDEDIIVYAVKDNQAYILIFNIYKGTLHNKVEFVLEYQEGFFEEFISRYYEENEIPQEIILEKPVSEAMQPFLSEKRGSKVSILVPQKGEKKELLDLAVKNLEIVFFGKLAKLERLRERLKLQDTPRTIECFDISHLGGTSTVGSMVQFRNGVPYKSGYRRFKITTVEGIDDFKSIAEIVRRRYARLVYEKQEMPNLIIIDGGKGQLSSAVEELKKFNLRIPIISLAKRDEEVFVPGFSHPIRLDRKDSALQLLQEIRDEAHRFAITYNRLLRSKKIKEEILKE